MIPKAISQIYFVFPNCLWYLSSKVSFNNNLFILLWLTSRGNNPFNKEDHMLAIREGGQKWGNLIGRLNWDPLQGEAMARFLWSYLTNVILVVMNSLKLMLFLKPNFLWFFRSRLFTMASNATMDKVAKAKATIELYYTTLLAHTRERKERYENISQSWKESECLECGNYRRNALVRVAQWFKVLISNWKVTGLITLSGKLSFGTLFLLPSSMCPMDQKSNNTVMFIWWVRLSACFSSSLYYMKCKVVSPTNSSKSQYIKH